MTAAAAGRRGARRTAAGRAARRRSGSPGAALLLLLLLGAPAGAADEPPPPPPPPPLQLAEWLEREQPLVVVGRAPEPQRVGPSTLVFRLEVELRLHAPRAAEPPAAPLVITQAGHVARDQRGLFFLRPFRGGPRWELVQHVSASDPDFAPRLAVLRSVLALFELETRAAREAAAFELLVEGLVAEAEWERAWALDELRWLDRTHPRVLQPARRRRLALLVPGLEDPELRAGVESVAGSTTAGRDP